MIIAVDTSAVVAVLAGEPEAAPFRNVLESAARIVISTGSLIELFRLTRLGGGSEATAEVEQFLRFFRCEAVAVDRIQVEHARVGIERFGKGRAQPPAVLNFGDLFAYALARALSAPLLFKGDDFAQTDVIPAWRP